MKKMFALALAAVMSLSVLSGCASKYDQTVYCFKKGRKQRKRMERSESSELFSVHSSKGSKGYLGYPQNPEWYVR